MKVLQFQITEEIYKQAIEANSGACIVAEAIKEAYPNLSGIRVNAGTIRVTDKEAGERYTFLTPTPVRDALLFFDQGWKEDELPKKLRLVNLARIAPIITPTFNRKRTAENRARRLAELKAKEQKGELTRDEKRSLTIMRKNKDKKPPERPTGYGRATVDENDVIHGGSPIPDKRGKHGLHPNMLAGKHRHFGEKTSQPSRVIREIVAEAIAEDRKLRNQ